jgi:hypothetical protein
MAQDIDKIKDIFGINPKEKHSSDDEIYGELSDAQNKESFEDKVNMVKEMVGTVDGKELEVKKDEKADAVEEVPSNILTESVSMDDDIATIIQETNQEEIVEEPPVEEVLTGTFPIRDDVEALGDALKVAVKYPEKVGWVQTDGKPIECIDLKDGDNSDVVEEVTEKYLEEVSEDGHTGSIEPIVNLDEWNLTSPSPKFDSFYREKANILNRVLKSDMIPIERYTQELIDAKVDVSVPIYDLPQIHKRMQEVQAWRDRVKEIQMNCNSQYYKFETAYEFLKGLLARVEYAKPAVKQEGVIYEHLSDFGLYFSDLKGIHRSAEIVSKNLDNAYETLSRQLTIALPNKNIERMGDVNTKNHFNPKDHEKDIVAEIEEKSVEVVEEKEIPEELKEFDILDQLTASVKKANEKVKAEVEVKDVNLESAAKEASWDLL